MSQETLQTLNLRTLIGFTDKRGHNAWHYRKDLQGDEDNHYPGAIPPDDVIRRLFNFTVVETEIYIVVNGQHVVVPERKAMITSDNSDVLGIFKESYQGHDYQEWLLNNVSLILDDTLGIGSAGLLKNRGQAFVTVEVPENIITPEGVEFRPNLLACTSFDGSLATTYKRVITTVVCDNTLSLALGESGQEFKLRHSRYSNLRIGDAREALAIVYSMADDFTKEVAQLTKQKVTKKQFENILDLVIPIPELPEGKEKHRGVTVANKKRDEVTALYNNDERAAPWKGTAYGVLAAFNTYNQHLTQVRKGTPRVIRNMENVVSGKSEQFDRNIIDKVMLAVAA